MAKTRIKSEIAIAVLFLVTVAQMSTGMPSTSLIYGGEEAIPGEFPWMVSIQTPKGDSSGHVHSCGGTLISSTKIVTAAHCSYNLPYYPVGDVRVVAGVHNLTASNDEWEQIRYVYPTKIYTHYLYNKEDTAPIYDVSVIELATPFIETDRVSWAPMAHASSANVCQIAGWGTTESNSDLSDVLRKAQVPIVSKNDCQAIYPGLFHNESQICAGRPEGGVDVCFGDTGGAMICSNIGYKFFAGIASSGFFCGVAGKPGIYTETSNVINWIINPSSTPSSIGCLEKKG